jgi:predicted RNase H-like nuclease
VRRPKVDGQSRNTKVPDFVGPSTAEGPLTTVPSTFIGIDLAWKSEHYPTGATVLRESVDGAVLADVAPPLRSLHAVMEYVRAHETRPCVIAIDAPLIIPNATGQRACERLVGQRYGARHASCHTSNRTLYPDAASVRLAHALAERGFAHAPEHQQTTTAVMLEVYPHAAMVALYDLPQIVKYKKGRIVDRRTGVRRLQQLLGLLTIQDPPLVANDALEELLGRPVAALAGQALKDYEDSLDALICAYIAYHYWTWGGKRTEMFGDVSSGYIANPYLQLEWAQGPTPKCASVPESVPL